MNEFVTGIKPVTPTYPVRPTQPASKERKPDRRRKNKREPSESGRVHDDDDSDDKPTIDEHV